MWSFALIKEPLTIDNVTDLNGGQKQNGEWVSSFVSSLCGSDPSQSLLQAKPKMPADFLKPEAYTIFRKGAV